MSDDAGRLTRLFLEACEIPPEERAAFLDTACASDAGLRSEIEAMLEADDRAGAGRGTAELAGPIDRAASGSPAPHLHGAPERIGRFRILEKLGEGGMGVVYRAEQTEPVRREVALKIVRAVLDSAAALARFEVEQQALALMDHTNVARLYEAGTTEDGRPYFAMELVRGVPITQYCDSRKLGLKDRLTLFLDVCRGVRHAHRRGVIHRDLKPSNILIAEEEEAKVVPKVIDFSIAKALGEPGLGTEFRTRTGQVIGTLEYMSPEQAAGRTAAVDTRSDVYALGVVLYELISGTLPHELEGQPLHEAVRRIVQEPPRLLKRSTATSADRVGEDLATIVDKCLEKEPDRRYGSADDLVEDLERYLDSRPIRARPPSTMYQARKLVGRHRVLFGSMTAALVVLLVFSVTVTVQLEIQRRERHRAEREQRKAQKINSFLQEMLAAADPAKEGGKVSIREVLDKASARMEKSLEGEPELAAELHGTLGGSYGGLGVYDQAREHLEKSLALRKQLYGDDHPETARAHLDLVWLGPAEEGEAHARSALRIFRSQEEPADQDVARALGRLADILYKQGKLEESRSAAEESVSIARRSTDVPGEVAGSALNILGTTLSDLGHRGEGEMMLRESASFFKAARGDHSLAHLDVLSDLAYNLGSQGRLDEAVALGEEILAGRIAILGKDHPIVAISQNNLAAHLMNAGRCAEAEPHQQEALRIWSEGNGDVNAATAWNNIGFIRQCYGNYEGAREAYFSAERLAEEHPAESTVMREALDNNLGAIEGRLGRFEKGKEYLRRSLDATTARLGSDTTERWGVLNNIGSVLLEERKLEEAEKVLRESLRLLRSGLEAGGHQPEGNPLYPLATNTLGRALAARGKLTEAEDLLGRARPSLLASMDDVDRRRHELKRTAELYDRLHRPADAAAYREALARLDRMTRGKR